MMLKKEQDKLSNKNIFEEHKFKKYEKAIGYGISFYKKQCYVVKVEYNSKI